MNKIKWLRNLWILIMILLLGNSTFSQNTERIKIQITQQGLPSGISYFYSLDNSRLKVFKITKTNKILKCYKYLNKIQLDSIVHYTTKIIDQNYDSLYFGGAIDGVLWEFEIEFNETHKKVLIDNYYLESFDNLIVIINNSLPLNRQYIRMED
ncbi:MAG: hypothetical protein PHQ01_03060 [Candidatus Pacebacteria bacterium]|nr:hypothetical protein [Candidatus Paceibacterota bacterium]